jgi:hypothetical protein
MPIAKVQPIAEVHHLFQKIRPVREALQNPGELVPPWVRLPPTGHNLGKLAGGFVFRGSFNEGHTDNYSMVTFAQFPITELHRQRFAERLE